MTKVQQENLSAKEHTYHCSLCEKQFKWKSEMKRHELSHNPQYNCNICSKKFSFLSALRRHEKTHERIEPVLCKECGGTFRDETLLKRHFKYAHNGETFNCTKCSAYFSSEIALQTHSKIHKVNSERRYKCRFDGCEKTFNFPHHLKHHELTHTGSKQHFCSVCGKGFIQAHHLKTHMKGHEPENWLYCNIDQCNKRFSNQYALKRHIMTHKNKKENKAALPMIVDDQINQINSNKIKSHVLCDICGELIRQNQISRHSIKCQKNSKENAPIDLKINQHNLEENSNSSLEIFAEIKDNGNRIEDIIKLEFGNCKKSGCAGKDGKPDENCLCANIATSPDNISLEDISPQPIERANVYENLNKKMNCLSFSEKKYYTAIEEIVKNENDVDYDSCKNVFGGCLVSKDGQPNENCICAKFSKRNTKNLSDCNNCVVKCDDYYKSDDMYDDKIDENNDMKDGDKDDQAVSNSIITKRLNDCNNCMVKCEDYYKTVEKADDFGESKDDQTIPYSCKAALGNCIVSGDSTIGEECLCAKMYNGVNGSHEIEDLTPLSSMIWTD